MPHPLRPQFPFLQTLLFWSLLILFLFSGRFPEAVSVRAETIDRLTAGWTEALTAWYIDHIYSDISTAGGIYHRALI